MKFRDTDYVYATMRIRANEKSLLTSSQISRMVDAKTPEEAAKILAEAGYPEVSARSFSDVCQSISKMQEQAISLVAEISENSALKDVFLLKYDFHNIKAILKAQITGENPEHIMSRFSTVPPSDLISAVRLGDFSNIPKKMAEAISVAAEKLSHTRNPQISDFVLDAACFDMMLDEAKASGSEFLLGYAKLMCDAANIRTAVRVRRRNLGNDILESAYVPGGNVELSELLSNDLASAYGSSPLLGAAEISDLVSRGEVGFTEFERELDNSLIAYMREARYVSFNEKPLVAYLAAKETEAQTVRIIMAGKFENLSPEQIRIRLRGINNG